MAFNNKGALTIGLIVVFLLIVAGGIVYITLQDRDEVGGSQDKLRVCPDVWYDNQMPGEETEEARQYFIIGGERKELESYDIPWIRENCAVNEPQVVS